MPTDALIGAASAFLIAVFTTPVGVSGAVFLVPVQVSVLHTPSPSITPTNLLYNVIATPGALLRYRGRAVLSAPLTRTLLLGTLPGVIVGSVLVGLGFGVAEVAPAALASTFLTSIVGVVTYAILSLRHSGSIAPDWTVGVAMGIGGLGGGYIGTSLQSRIPEAALRRSLGVVAVALAVRYAVLAAT